MIRVNTLNDIYLSVLGATRAKPAVLGTCTAQQAWYDGLLQPRVGALLSDDVHLHVLGAPREEIRQLRMCYTIRLVQPGGCPYVGHWHAQRRTLRLVRCHTIARPLGINAVGAPRVIDVHHPVLGVFKSQFRRVSTYAMRCVVWVGVVVVMARLQFQLQARRALRVLQLEENTVMQVQQGLAFILRVNDEHTHRSPSRYSEYPVRS